MYPAGHVMIYDALYRLTDEGSDIFRAQCIFAFVYLAALSTVMACYRQAKVRLLFRQGGLSDCIADVGIMYRLPRTSSPS